MKTDYRQAMKRISCLGIIIFFLSSLTILAFTDNADAERRRSSSSAKHYNCVDSDSNLGGRLFDFVVTSGVHIIPVQLYKHRITPGQRLCYENSTGNVNLWVEMVGETSAICRYDNQIWDQDIRLKANATSTGTGSMNWTWSCEKN